jgi:hypothetical protein
MQDNDYSGRMLRAAILCGAVALAIVLFGTGVVHCQDAQACRLKAPVWVFVAGQSADFATHCLCTQDGAHARRQSPSRARALDVESSRRDAPRLWTGQGGEQIPPHRQVDVDCSGELQGRPQPYIMLERSRGYGGKRCLF